MVLVVSTGWRDLKLAVRMDRDGTASAADPGSFIQKRPCPGITYFYANVYAMRVSCPRSHSSEAAESMEYSTYTRPSLAVPSFELYQLGRSRVAAPGTASANWPSMVPAIRRSY